MHVLICVIVYKAFATFKENIMEDRWKWTDLFHGICMEYKLFVENLVSEEVDRVRIFFIPS